MVVVGGITIAVIYMIPLRTLQYTVKLGLLHLTIVHMHTLQTRVHVCMYVCC